MDRAFASEVKGCGFEPRHCRFPDWNESLRADTQEWAIYAVGLLHNVRTPSNPETKPVVKAVRYGITFLALPSEEAVELVERVIAK